MIYTFNNVSPYILYSSRHRFLIPEPRCSTLAWNKPALPLHNYKTPLLRSQESYQLLGNLTFMFANMKGGKKCLGIVLWQRSSCVLELSRYTLETQRLAHRWQFGKGQDSSIRSSAYAPPSQTQSSMLSFLLLVFFTRP